jgi:hypothetical protein
MVSAAPFSSMWRFMKLTGRGLGADGQDALAARGHTIVGMVAMCSGHPARGDAGGGSGSHLMGIQSGKGRQQGECAEREGESS